MNIWVNILSVVVILMLIVFLTLYIKGKISLALNPILAIIFGYIAFLNVFNFLYIFFHGIDSLIFQDIMIAISAFIGGFVATFFSRDNKILYAFVFGIFMLIFALIVGYGTGFGNIKILGMFLVNYSISIVLAAVIGGFFGNKSKKFIIKKHVLKIENLISCKD